MRIFTLSLGTLIALVLATGSTTAQNKYTGVKLCAACHKTGKGGTAYAVWEKSQHAKAYETLLSDKAKKIAKEKGIKGAPSESEACLKCHVAGGGVAENVEKTFKLEEGVTCEVCHGPASGYKIIHSKDLKKAKAAGLTKLEKSAESCVTCHNEESPSFKGFKFDEMWAKIEHSKKKK
ncbi:MAG: cytochrome c family protein [Ignavibacteria bacterium]|nr:cytochrome c family protein [Ignavibacteria bacterium]